MAVGPSGTDVMHLRMAFILSSMRAAQARTKMDRDVPTAMASLMITPERRDPPIALPPPSAANQSPAPSTRAKRRAGGGPA